MTEHSPDPVSEGVAYRQMLFEWAGTEDPAITQATTPARLRSLITSAGADLRTRPDAAEWSVLEGVAHIVHAEMVMTARYRWTLAHDEPPLIGYDQDRWIDRLGANEDDPEKLLDLFEALRTANIDLWKRTPATDRPRAGIHAERGPETYGDAFRLIAGHDRFHLDQAERALAAVRKE